jgi:hypothetical protein
MERNLKHAAGLVLPGILLGLSFATQATNLNKCNKDLLASETQQLSFGTLASSGGGTVTVSPAGARSRTGSVSLLGGTVNAGVMTVTTPNNNCHCYPLSIVVLDGTATLASGGNSMAMSSITTNPTTSDAVTLGSAAGSSLQINVGANLTVGATQAAGTYNTAADIYTLSITLLEGTTGKKCP